MSVRRSDMAAHEVHKFSRTSFLRITCINSVGPDFPGDDVVRRTDGPDINKWGRTPFPVDRPRGAPTWVDETSPTYFAPTPTDINKWGRTPFPVDMPRGAPTWVDETSPTYFATWVDETSPTYFAHRHVPTWVVVDMPTWVVVDETSPTYFVADQP
jgi:hypothetical protein